jgi:hypothetical protein
MILGRAERYSIEQHDDRVVLLMKQGVIGVRVGIVCAVVLIGTWWIGPYGPQTIAALRTPDVFYWIWSGFFIILVLASLLGAPFIRKDIEITDDEVIAESVVYGSKSSRRISRGRPLGIRVEKVPIHEDGPMFPYRVHFLDANGKDAGLFIELQRKASVDRLLEALRSAVTLDVRQADRPDVTS